MTAIPTKTDSIRCAAFENGRYSRQTQAYQLFKDGLDTFDIGQRMHVHESIICRWIDRERDGRWNNASQEETA